MKTPWLFICGAAAMISVFICGGCGLFLLFIVIKYSALEYECTFKWGILSGALMCFLITYIAVYAWYRAWITFDIAGLARQNSPPKNNPSPAKRIPWSFIFCVMLIFAFGKIFFSSLPEETGYFRASGINSIESIVAYQVELVGMGLLNQHYCKK